MKTTSSNENQDTFEVYEKSATLFTCGHLREYR